MAKRDLDFNDRDDSDPDTFHGQMKFAQMFTRAYGHRLICARGIGWHEWTGTRWERCQNGAPGRAIKHLIRKTLRDIWKVEEVDKRNALMREVTRIETKNGADGVLALASDYIPCAVTVDQLDAHPDLLNTASGILDLNTGEISKPDPSKLMTKVTSATFNPEAESSAFHEFLERIQPDEEMRKFLARSLGSALLGRVRDHVLFIWHGDGANGKSTLRNAIRNALGDYAVEIDPVILLESKQGQKANGPERMRLQGIRLAFCSEIANGAKMDEAMVKKLTGGENVNAELKYQNPVEFPPSHTLFMLTNYLPEISGDDNGVWRRQMAVPFSVIIPEEEWDLDLDVKLAAESETVLSWLYLGWLDYQANGLNPPDKVQKYTNQYRVDSDVLGRFIDDRCITGPNFVIRCSDLFTAWQKWCIKEGVDPGSMTKFGKAMAKRGMPSEDTGRFKVYRGIGLVAEADEGDNVIPWRKGS